eukprot:1518416-Ditylum_brightwellii.AAC.1
MDGYLDDGIIIALDLPATTDKAAAALPLALHLLFCPLHQQEPIRHTDILSLRKLASEGTLRKILKYIGWVINTRAFTIALPQDKAAEWL